MKTELKWFDLEEKKPNKGRWVMLYSNLHDEFLTGVLGCIGKNSFFIPLTSKPLPFSEIKEDYNLWAYLERPKEEE